MLTMASKDSFCATIERRPFSTKRQFMIEVLSLVCIRMGNSVRLPAPAMEPQGAVLSAAADHTRSLGHMKAAGPMSSEVIWAMAADASMARPATAETKGAMPCKACKGPVGTQSLRTAARFRRLFR